MPNQAEDEVKQQYAIPTLEPTSSPPNYISVPPSCQASKTSRLTKSRTQVRIQRQRGEARERRVRRRRDSVSLAQHKRIHNPITHLPCAFLTARFFAVPLGYSIRLGKEANRSGPKNSKDGDVSTADTVADGGPDEDQEADGDFKP